MTRRGSIGCNLRGNDAGLFPHPLGHFGMLDGMWPGPIGTLLAMAVAVFLVAVVVLFVSAILRLAKRKDK